MWDVLTNHLPSYLFCLFILAFLAYPYQWKGVGYYYRHHISTVKVSELLIGTPPPSQPTPTPPFSLSLMPKCSLVTNYVPCRWLSAPFQFASNLDLDLQQFKSGLWLAHLMRSNEQDKSTPVKDKIIVASVDLVERERDCWVDGAREVTWLACPQPWVLKSRRLGPPLVISPPPFSSSSPAERQWLRQCLQTAVVSSRAWAHYLPEPNLFLFFLIFPSFFCFFLFLALLLPLHPWLEFIACITERAHITHPMRLLKRLHEKVIKNVWIFMKGKIILNSWSDNYFPLLYAEHLCDKKQNSPKLKTVDLYVMPILFYQIIHGFPHLFGF